jgi:hypothetical protein
LRTAPAAPGFGDPFYFGLLRVVGCQPERRRAWQRHTAALSARFRTCDGGTRQPGALPVIARRRHRIAEPLGCATEIVKRQVVLVPGAQHQHGKFLPSPACVELRHLGLHGAPGVETGITASEQGPAGLQHRNQLCWLLCQWPQILGAAE